MEENKKNRGLGKGLSELLGEARAKAAFSKQSIKPEEEQFTNSQRANISSKLPVTNELPDLDKELEALDKEFSDRVIDDNKKKDMQVIDNELPQAENLSFIDNHNLVQDDDDEFETVTTSLTDADNHSDAQEEVKSTITNNAFQETIHEIPNINAQDLIQESIKNFEEHSLIENNLLEITDNIIIDEKETQYLKDDKIEKEENIDTIVSSSTGNLKKIPIEYIMPNKEQPRKFFDINSLNDLAASINMYGIIQPIIVNQSGSEYVIVAGERRWRASQLAGLKEIPVVIANYAQAETLEVALIENIQRANLSPLEEAKAYYNLIQKYELTQNEVAQKVGKSRSHVANMVRLLELNDTVKEYLEKGDITIGHARVLVGLNNASELAEKIVKSNLSVRKVEELVALQGAPLKSAILPKAVKTGKDVDILALESDLKAALGVGVAINTQSKQKGQMIIRYESLEQLDEICKRLCSTTGDDFV